MAEQKTNPVDRPTSPDQAAAKPTGKFVRWLKAYRWPLVGTVAALLVAGAGTAWYFNHESRPEPSALLARALECLDDHENPAAIAEARGRITSELDALKYRDPTFPGAVPYILGIVHFRRARLQTDRERFASFRSAVTCLEQASSGLDDSHRLQADFAIGISRSAIGDNARAEASLRRVVEAAVGEHSAQPGPEFFEAAAALQDGYVNQRGPNHLKQAIALNDAVLSKTNLKPDDRDRTLLRRAQIFVALHDADNAQQALSQVSNESAAQRGTALIRAQVDIAEGRFDKTRFKKAHEELEPLANETGLDSLYPRQALFLLGVCHEAEADFENALRKYADVVRRYPDTQEGLAANVRRAELLRRAQRWEEAIDAYVKALELVRPTGFSNRWLRLDEFRNQVVGAWNDLKETRAYEFAVELARHMQPLFPRNQSHEALERVATANQLWASQIEMEIADRPYRVREERQPELLERWRTSGKAYADLAENLHESPKYADILWISSEHYRKGHDFPNALVQMTRFINAQPIQRLPLAYVRRGEILMDLGRFDEALDHFERVLTEFPNDIASFQAMYLLGACEVERDNSKSAVQAWLRVLHDGHLDPAANEWQTALFALGRLHFQMAMAVKKTNAAPADSDDTFKHLDNAIRRLEEFVARYPRRPEAPEARFLLAKALRDRAQLPHQKLQRAETDNARKELRAEIQWLLTEAQNQIDSLIEMLQAKETAGLLDPLSQRMLRDSYFERAHNLYALENYDRAIEAYTNAANRYAEDPNVFLAYLQMANCYDRLGKPIDARGVAIQAMLIHKNMPDKAFARDKTLMNRAEWRTWLEWAGNLRQMARREERRPPGPATAASASEPGHGGPLVPTPTRPLASRETI